MRAENLVFGSSMAQNDKLMYHGQHNHFYGREGALGPGGYDPETNYGSISTKHHNRLSHLSRKGAAPARD